MQKAQAAAAVRYSQRSTLTEALALREAARAAYSPLTDTVSLTLPAPQRLDVLAFCVYAAAAVAFAAGLC